MSTATITKTTQEPKLHPSFVLASATEVQQNFSKYTSIAESGQDVIIQKNGKSVARLISERKGTPLLTDLVGILKGSRLKSTKDVYEDKRRRYEATGRL